MNIEEAYDDNTMISATVAMVNNSFDHEFGRAQVADYIVTDIHIRVFIRGFDYDVTVAFTSEEIEIFREWILEKFVEKNVA